jgi:hypothetical protein
MMGRRAHETDKVKERNGFKFITLKGGRTISFLDALKAAESGHTAISTAISRAFKLRHDDPELGEWDLERIEWFLDELERYIGAMRKHLERERSTQRAEERIAALRSTQGRTPEEASAYLAKADALERRLADSSRTV